MSWITWIKEKLGITNSVYMSDKDSSDSDSDEEPSYSECASDSQVPTTEMPSIKRSSPTSVDLTTDAAVRIASLPIAETIINTDTVRYMEDHLDPNEIVSLVFLLYDQTHLALQELILFLQGSNKKLLYEWTNYEQNKSGWQRKLVESLCIIKNYQLLKKFGYNKSDLVLHYLPHQANTSLHVNKLRKALYIICEKLDSIKTMSFVDNVRKYFHGHNLQFTEYNFMYLELYFLNWLSIGYIQETNLSNLKNIFKIMEDDTLLNLVEDISPRMVSSPKAQDAVENYHNLRNDRPSSSYEYNEVNTTNDSQRYDIDPDNPGVVLIINQEEFYTEVRSQYKHLLPPNTTVKLESRLGTKMDKQKLEKIFQKFGFKIIDEDNLTHVDMIEKIKEVVASIKEESSFFLCILSHGDKGIVYGCNSCKVKISYIQQLVSKSTLLGKPKVLILQSCQGRQCQILNENGSDDDFDDDNMSLTTDGPSVSRQALTRTSDLLLFWATVPGYAAIRDKRNGSWFIQALCKQMDELQNKIHFADICTRTSREVTNKVWDSEEEKKAMTPMVVSTLRFDFFLPPMKKS